MNTLITTQEIEKINTLTLLSEEKRQQLIEAAPFTAIPYMPVTVDFIEQHILNNTEYPLVESKLSQAAIELKARINRLVDAQFNINKLTLEIEELQLDIEDIKNDGKLSEARQKLQIAKKELDIRQKKWIIISHNNESDTNYQEFTQWKQTIEDCIATIRKNDPTITDFTKIRYDQIRMGEIEIKIQRWKAMKAAGIELTPSQQVLVGD
jgi:hypothetical protein